MVAEDTSGLQKDHLLHFDASQDTQDDLLIEEMSVSSVVRFLRFVIVGSLPAIGTVTEEA